MDDQKTIDGWWFSAEPKLPHGDDRPIVIGETLTVAPPIIPCERGLHLSVRAIDALQYAPGSLCYRVRGSGEMKEHEGDKLACSERTALWMIDAEPVLRRFARQCALDVVHLWKASDVVMRYLITGDESSRAAAWDAARAAAWDAARDAARAAALDAARAAAWDAAWAAAWDAAWAAAWDAAWDAANDAAWAKQNMLLEQMLTDYHNGTLDLTAPLSPNREGE